MMMGSADEAEKTRSSGQSPVLRQLPPSCAVFSSNTRRIDPATAGINGFLPASRIVRALPQDATSRGIDMHRAPTPVPEQEPLEEDDAVPEPGEPAPERDPVPDHNPS